MKQSKNSAAAFDLDDLERELQQVVAPRGRPASTDDPLAELARIVGQDAAAKETDGAKAAFADFLAAPPQPAADAAPVGYGPAAALASAAFQEPTFANLSAAPAPTPIAAAPVPAQPKIMDPLEALLAQDLGLRSGLDELPEPKSPPKGPDPLASLDALIAGAPDSSGSEPDVSAEEASALHAAFEAELAKVTAAPAGDIADPVAEQPPMQEAIAAAQSVPEPEAVADGVPRPEFAETAPAPAAQRPDAKFDDMIAEFEAAMRDVGSASVGQSAASASGQAMIQPPPGDIIVAPIPPVTPPHPAQDLGKSAGLGAAAAAGAAAIGAAAVARPRPQRRGLMLAGGVIAVAVIGLGALAVFGSRSASNQQVAGNVPVIAAKPGVTKERPANPGGVEVPNQDKEILQSRSAPVQHAERVAPREEQPVDLVQAQRQATANGSSAPATTGSGQVRQIPGVAIVAPVSTTPPANAASDLPVETQPRPVASVPITIAGQPPQTFAPLSPAAVAPPPAPLNGATPPVQPPAAPAAPAAAATAPAAVPPSQRAAPAQPQAASSEPRRVRSVPIRPDAGEAAPNRAQSQPRVVAAAPAPAAAPEAANAPLRLSPQANRPAPAAAPAAVQPGTVPSSRPTLEDEPAPVSRPTTTASTGSGSGFSVQLAAEGSEEAARTKMNRMRGQFGSVIGDASPTIRSAEVNGRNVYRVRVGNMSREEAVSMCERLKASGGSCFVARN